MIERQLFRGKLKDSREWITGTNLRYLNNDTWLLDSYEVTSDSTGICANLPDKNGKLIWEKDIVKYSNHIGVVIYESGCCSLKYEYKNSVHKIAIIEKYDDYKEMEVIGNICDNHELLEVPE